MNRVSIDIHNTKIKLVGDAYKDWLEGYDRYFNEVNNPEVAKLFDYQLRIVLSITDIGIGLKYLQRALDDHNKSEESYFSRILIINLFEMMNSINSLSMLRNISADVPIHNRIRILLKEMNKATNSYKGLKKVRDELIGHRLGTGLEQNVEIKKINSTKVYTICDGVFDKSLILALTLEEFSKSLIDNLP